MSTILSEALPWVQALGWTLLHFIWQGLVVGIGFASARALLPKANCNARYAAGLAALSLMTLWPLATFIALRPRSLDGVVANVAVATDVGTLAVAADSTALAPIDHLLPALVLLWSVGVAIVAMRALRQWRALARVARHWATSSDELDGMLAGLSRRFRFMRRIRVLISDRIDTPMLIGWIKPIVLLPTAVALGFPRQQVELILAHELGHLRRYDHLVNLAQALLETLLFYHPVVHWISREVRNERELCCDMLVLRLTAGEPREYARTLAALEDLRQPSVQVALAASGGVLLERVRRIVGMPAPRLRVDRLNAARWMVVAMVFAVAVSMALRVDRAGQVRYVAGLTADWLTQPGVRALPIAALTVPFERKRLRLVEVASPSVDRAAMALPSVDTRSAAASVANGADARSASAKAVAAVVPHEPLSFQSPPVTTSVAPSTAQAVSSTSSAVAHEAAVDAVVPAPTPKAPVATHLVSPVFPSTWHSADGRVDASFQIGADGSLRDIQIADNGAGAAFVRAAERAMRQWRFDPASLSGDRSKRFQQSFVFAAMAPRGANARPENACVTSTGSLICRQVEDGLPSVSIAADIRR
ncbi:MAG: TonB family protein [Dokdonella sp.]